MVLNSPPAARQGLPEYMESASEYLKTTYGGIIEYLGGFLRNNRRASPAVVHLSHTLRVLYRTAPLPI
jgi:hypothetical protein